MAQQPQQQLLAFTAEWLDPSNGVLWRYQLLFWPGDPGEVELFDVKHKRAFLRRVKCPGLEQQQLYLGATVTVCARQLRLIAFGDDATRRAVEERCERTLALIKPDVLQHAGKILHAIQAAGLAVTNARMCQLSKQQAAAFYAVHSSQPFFDALTSHMSSGQLLALELMGGGSIRKWRELLGPTNSHVARQQAPASIRGQFGSDGTRNVAHGSDSPASAAAELSFFFGSSSSGGGGGGDGGGVASDWGVPCCARCRGTTLGVIKPHVLRDGAAGELLDAVLGSFDVTGLTLLHLSRAAACELLECYRRALAPAEFAAAVDELSSGPCLALEVASKAVAGAASPAEPFRQLCGPADPELARAVRPHSLRARHGSSMARNAVHCTDLPEDCEQETAYCFTVLAAAR